VTNTDEETLRFVTASFPSVWALELLLALKRAGGKCARPELIEKLRASELVVSKALDALEAAGLVSVEGDGAVYLPANKGVEASVDRAEDLYRRRPNAVCRAIVSANVSGATAFADAFRIRRERDD
jgi:hypothetical protein